MDTATDVTRHNDARIREYWEVFNTHDVAKGSTFLTEDYVNHAAPKAPAGPQGWRLIMGAISRAFRTSPMSSSSRWRSTTR